MRKHQGGRQQARHAPERLIPSLQGEVTSAMFLVSPPRPAPSPTSHSEAVLLALKVLKFLVLWLPGLTPCG